MSSKEVYYDLTTTPYVYTYDDFTYYFSSAFNLERFTNQIKHFLDLNNMKYANKFKAKEVDLYPILSVVLYKSIEKRGYRVTFDNKELKYDYTILSVFSPDSFRS